MKDPACITTQIPAWGNWTHWIKYWLSTILIIADCCGDWRYVSIISLMNQSWHGIHLIQCVRFPCTRNSSVTDFLNDVQVLSYFATEIMKHSVSPTAGLDRAQLWLNYLKTSPSPHLTLVLHPLGGQAELTGTPVHARVLLLSAEKKLSSSVHWYLKMQGPVTGIMKDPVHSAEKMKSLCRCA